MVKQSVIWAMVGVLGLLGYYTYEVYYNPNQASQNRQGQQQKVTQVENEKIKQRVPVTMYSMASCRYCTLAKELLERRGVKVDIKDITTAEHQAEMARKTDNARSVPQIFIGSTHIGGYRELVNLDQGNQLAALLLGQVAS